MEKAARDNPRKIPKLTQKLSHFLIATTYSGLDKDKAFSFLENAYQERSPDIPYFLKADLRLDPLRSDPRFQDLVHRVGLTPQTPISACTPKLEISICNQALRTQRLGAFVVC